MSLRSFRHLWLVAFAFICTAFGTTAQAGPPFMCSGDIYQVQSGQLRIFDPITSSYQNVGPRNGSYNASGYNVLDNYAYASQGQNIIRISSDGTIENVFNIGFGSFSGDVDFSNNYWLRRNNTRYARINLATGAVVNVNFSGPSGGPADVAYDQNGGQEYLIGFSGGGTLYRYNITTGTKENISVPGLPGGGFGATWTDLNGRLFTFSNNNGLLYEVTDYYTNSPQFTQVGVGVPSGNNDGFSCSLSPFPNLAPIAFDDDYATPVNVPISGSVIPGTGNGVDNDPDGGPISVTTTPLLGPSDGTVVLNSDGTFTYTPNLNFVGFDAFEYEITDSAGLTATAIVTIEVIGDPDYSVTKTQTGGPATATAAGQMLTYEIEVLNTGDVPLTDVQVSDTLPDGSAGSVGAPNETGAATNVTGQLDLNETWTYTTSYTVTQDDIDAGDLLVNRASVTTDETGALAKTDTAETPIARTPDFTISKVVDAPTLNTPGTLTYTITLNNTGNQSLTGVTIDDVIAQGATSKTLTSGPTLSGDTDGDGALDVTETWTYTATFAATQVEIDDGATITNTATVDTDQTAAKSDDADTTITQTPSFSANKTASSNTLSAPGTIAYQIALTNTGNTSVTGITPTDTLTQGATTLALTSGLNLSGDTDGDNELDLSETWLYTGTYAVGQDQIDDGASIVNDISITSANAGTETSQAITNITQTPDFSIVKTVDPTNLTAPGTLSYEIVVANTGNTTLTGVSLTDALSQGGVLTLTSGPTLSGDVDGDGNLDVNETWTYLASFAALQAQIDNGAPILNTATFDSVETLAKSDSATTMISQTDDVSLVKSVAPGQPTSFSAVGDTIQFSFTVRNTGNTTLVQPITITDDQIGGPLACGSSNLLPGASLTCLHPWIADQADLNAGSVTNTATAQDAAGTISAPQTATVTAVQTPALAIDKQIVPPVPGSFQQGQVLNYEYTVTNTGNVVITEPITVADNLTSVTCPALPGGQLVPQNSDPIDGFNSISCTANYTIGANDIDLGSTTNVANAATTFDGDPVVSPSDSAIFPVGAAPVIDLQKSAPAGLTVNETTDTITYTYRIENVRPAPPAIGGTFPGTVFINDDKFPNPIVCYDPAVEGSDFEPDDIHTCTATYTVTQDDLDAGEVVNEAVANAIFAPGSANPVDVVSNIDTVTVPVDDMPSLLLAKTVTAGPDPAAVGNVISYEIIATNDGNQTISNVVISDPLLGALSCDIPAPVTLAPGAALICDGTYTVLQSDIDGQTVGDAGSAEFTNTASVAGNAPDGMAINTDDALADHPLAAAAPSVAVLKEVFPDPAADPAFTNVGDVLRYRIRVTNDGNMTLSSVNVTDNLVPGTCTVGPLAPGASDATCIFDYTVDQNDLDTGQVTNIGAASAQPSDLSADPVTAEDTLVSPGPDFAGGLEVVKSGSLNLGPDGIATVGDQITYTITVRNTGNVTLRDTTITDAGADTIIYAVSDDPDGDNDINTLAPAGVALVTATHAITQDEINAGSFANSASATGSDPSGTPVTDTSDSANPGDGPGPNDPTVTPIPRNTGLSIDKSFAATAGTGAGDTITYSYVVQNTGNVTLTNVTLSDAHTSASGVSNLTISNGGVIATLAPGVSETLTAIYVITQEDIDAGNPLTNTVSASATGPAGTPPPTASDAETVPLESSDPSLETLKTVRSQSGSAPGDTIIFEVTVANTGNVTLSNVTLTDTLRRLDNQLVIPAPTPVFETGDGVTVDAIDVGETWVYRVDYVLTQDDIDAGGIRNSVVAQAEAPDNTPVSDVSDNGAGDGNDPTVVSIDAMPSLQAVKTITSSTIAVGGTVTFAITVENDGNVTLTDVAIVSDTLTRLDGTLLTLSTPTFAGASMGSVSGTLMVGETATYTASYVLTQDDIDAGGIENTARAQGTPPTGGPVSDVSDDDGAGADPTVLTIPASPVIDFEKRLVSGGPSFDAVGDVLAYEFEITNLGNVTLSPPYAISDPLITDAGGVVTCPTNDIAPNESVICTGAYSIIQNDLDAGSVLNAATATVGDADPVDADVTTPAQQNPALELAKVADNLEPEDFIVGVVANYTFTSTNTGNVTITNPITINDSLMAPGAITCDPFPATGLAPGDTYECRGTYTVTSEDVQIASVTNNATATDGTTTSPISSDTIPNAGVPALTLEKELISSRQPDGSDSGGLTFDEVGDQLEYQFTVTNSGRVSFARDIEVVDTFFADPIVCFSPTAGNPDLIPTESSICTAVYTVTQDDLDAGEIVNEASARTDFGDIPTVVQSPPATETTNVAANPMVTIEKFADRTAYAAVDEVVTFDFTVTNTGNQTLTNVAVNDPLIPGLICEAASLAVDGVLNCSVDYTVTQADIDRGSLTNVATASGIDPRGNAIPEVDDTVTLTGPRVAPTLGLNKLIAPNPFGGVGTSVVYTFEVTNTSIYTMSGITISDAVPGEFLPFTCTVGTLAPGAVNQSCQLVTEVTQDMVDDGEVTNTATVSGTDPFGNVAETTDTVVGDGPDEAPAIMATKLVEVPATTVGTTVTFTLVIENPGNVSLNLVLVNDLMVRNDGTNIMLDSPFVRLSGDTNFDGLLNPTEAWTFEAPYTITQDDVNAGGFSNVVNVQGTSPSGTVVRDIADNGDDSDGNDSDDPTVVNITTDPVLDVTKTVIASGSAVGDEVVFEIRAANRGNVDIRDAVPTDTLTRADGTDISANIVGPTRTTNPTDDANTIVSPAEYWSWEVRYVIAQEDVDAGGIQNSASVTGIDPMGNPVTDVSDNDNPLDGNLTNDGTLFEISPFPELDVVKTVASVGLNAGESIVFEIAVTNTGNLTLSDIAIEDTMTNLDGTIVGPFDIGVTGLANGILPVSATALYTLTYELTQADVDSGGISNTATATGRTPSGLQVDDVSDNGNDGDGNLLDDPTIALIPQEPAVIGIKNATIPDRIAPDLYQVTFDMEIINTGNITLTGLIAEDDLLPFVQPATLVSVNAPVVAGFTSGSANVGYDGVNDISLLAPGASLAPGETGSISLTIQYSTADGFPDGTNTLAVGAEQLDLEAVATAVIAQSDAPDILATKTATPTTATLGGTVTYTLTFLNRLATIESNLTLVDALPAGVVYTPGTATIDGVATEPAISARNLRWSPIGLQPNQTITVIFEARVVSGEAGEYVNRAYATDRDGTVVSNIATATITRRPEAVFDCADIIGKVFDDRNQNGYQDGVVADRAAITDQDIFDDKFDGKLTPIPEARGEPGLAGVRLSTVSGTLITTDEFGRFSVPCAELPAEIGSNFQLKLDTRTLPTGYHLTTENPRNVRVTPGRMTRLNFGATLSNLVEIDLTGDAFDGAEPNTALAGWLPSLVAQMEQEPSVLRLTYYRRAEDQSVANARLDALEDAVRQLWGRRDRYRLTVERTIHRTQ